MHHPILSKSLITKISSKLIRLPQHVCNWHHSIGLSPHAVNELLRSPVNEKKLTRKIRQKYELDLSALKQEQLRNILRMFITEIGKELNVDKRNLPTASLDHIIKHNRLQALVKEPDLNFKQLLQNTRPHIVLHLDPQNAYSHVDWRETTDYAIAKDALDLFNIDPQEIHPGFPSMPRRRGHEYMDPQDIIRLWDAAQEDAKYVVPVQLDLVEYLQNHKRYKKGIILPKGTEIWIHRYNYSENCTLNPAQGTSGPAKLKRDLHIKRSWPPDYEFIDERMYENAAKKKEGNKIEDWLDFESETGDSDEEHTSRQVLVNPFKPVFCKLNNIRSV